MFNILYEEVGGGGGIKKKKKSKNLIRPVYNSNNLTQIQEMSTQSLEPHPMPHHYIPWHDMLKGHVTHSSWMNEECD